MAEEITATALRANIYNILDTVVDEGEPIIISRKNRKLKVTLVGPAENFSSVRKDKNL